MAILFQEEGLYDRFHHHVRSSLATRTAFASLGAHASWKTAACESRSTTWSAYIQGAGGAVRR